MDDFSFELTGSRMPEVSLKELDKMRDIIVNLDPDKIMKLQLRLEQLEQTLDNLRQRFDSHEYYHGG